MSDPDIQSANEFQLPVPEFSESALQAGHATAESVEAFRDQTLENIRKLVQERGGLARRANEIRIAIGKEIAALQGSYAHPGDGDFLKRIESTGVSIPSAYRYLALYKKSSSIEKDLPPGTVPPQHVGNTDGGQNVHEESFSTNITPAARFRKPRRYGYVDLAELESRRAESQTASPALDVVKLEYTAEELLSFNVYVNQLSEQFHTKDRSKIVLWALQRVCAQYGYEDCATAC